MNRLSQLRGAWMRRPALGGLVLLLLLCASTFAQSTQPANTSIENQPIRRDRANENQQAAVTPPQAKRPSTIWDLSRVIMALGIVIGLILLMRWAGKRFLPGLAGGRAAGVVRVLARAPVSPRQQVLLVQVGRRVLIVADNGTQMNRLSEIDEPDEVAALLGQLTPTSPAPTEEFGEELGKASRSFEQNMDVQPEAEGTVETEPGAEVAQDAPQPAPGEIEDLMQKVRGLAKQLGRG